MYIWRNFCAAVSLFFRGSKSRSAKRIFDPRPDDR